MLIRVEIYDNNYKRIHVGNTVKVKAIENEELVEIEGKLEELDTEYLCFSHIDEKGTTYYLEVKFEDVKSLEFIK